MIARALKTNAKDVQNQNWLFRVVVGIESARQNAEQEWHIKTSMKHAIFVYLSVHLSWIVCLATLMITEEELERTINEQREKANMVVEKYKELCQKLHLVSRLEL